MEKRIEDQTAKLLTAIDEVHNSTTKENVQKLTEARVKTAETLLLFLLDKILEDIHSPNWEDCFCESEEDVIHEISFNCDDSFIEEFFEKYFNDVSLNSGSIGQSYRSKINEIKKEYCLKMTAPENMFQLHEKAEKLLLGIDFTEKEDYYLFWRSIYDEKMFEEFEKFVETTYRRKNPFVREETLRKDQEKYGSPQTFVKDYFSNLYGENFKISDGPLADITRRLIRRFLECC